MEYDNYNNHILQKFGNYELVEDLTGYYVNLIIGKRSTSTDALIREIIGKFTNLAYAGLFWEALKKQNNL